MLHTVETLRASSEKFYHNVMMVVGGVLWLALAVFVCVSLGDPDKTTDLVFNAVYGMPFVLFPWISAAAYRATAYGNMIMLGPKQFPELHQMVVTASHEIGLPGPPQAFLFNSNGLVNAYARRLLGGRFVFLTSALVEASSDAQVRFVVGHEIGHHAAGHLDPWMNVLKYPAHLVPFLGAAYSRACETTCDNIGAFLAADFEASRGALQMLGCGCRRLNGRMNCEAFMAQEELVPPIFGFLTEIFSTHPRLTRRVANIADYSASQRGQPEEKVSLGPGALNFGMSVDVKRYHL